MRKFLLFVFACLLINYNCLFRLEASNPTKEKIINKYDGLNFIIDDGDSDIYNSETGELKRCSLDESYYVVLTFAEKKNIEKMFQKINFLDIPDYFDIDIHSSGIITTVRPVTVTYIKMTKDSISKKVNLEMLDLENPILYKDKAFKYKKLYDYIWTIIKGKEEYKEIPRSTCIRL